MSRTIGTEGLNLIKRFEGCRLTAYQDSIGVWTIGYGHIAGVAKGQTITQGQADEFLRGDCATAEKAVNLYDGAYHWNQNQFDSMVSFAFNCGAGSLKNLLKSGARTNAEISVKLLEYNKAGGKVIAGLTKRRAAEKELFDRPMSNPGTADPGTPSYTVGGVYILQADKVNVRTGAGTDKPKVGYADLTAAAKQSAYPSGQLRQGTKVTCQQVLTMGSDVWIKIPSGWIVAYYGGKTYVG